MGRLSSIALAAALVCSVACERDGASSGQGAGSRERVNAVAATGSSADAEELCDRFVETETAGAFAWPKLRSSAPAGSRGWTWVNVWATWCKPCLEEIPMMFEWQSRLARAGHSMSLVLVSADEDDAALAAYQAQHPRTASTLRLADPGQLSDWLAAQGISGAGLPVHLWIDPEGHLRCVRASAITSGDFDRLAALISASR